MSNLLDYFAWRGDLSFAASPFCEVDNLVYSMLSFINLTDIVSDSVVGMPVKLSDAWTQYSEKFPNGEHFGQIIPQSTNDVFSLAANSVRFSDTYITAYRSETDEDAVSQFAAVTFVLPDNSIFVSFRGTDDTLVGWREDFNLSFMHPVVAQAKAVEYLSDIAAVHRGKIRLGGHSKGGNLAVYSAVFAPDDVKSRIIMAYSNDGPGFVEEVIESQEFRDMQSRICTFVPQSSVIGMLLEHKEDFHVIESTLNNGLFQHDPFSWSVVGNHFVHLGGLSKQGKRHDAVLRQWIRGMSSEDRRALTEILFGVLESTGAKTLTDLSVDRREKISAAIRAYTELDRDSKEHLVTLVRKLAEAGLNFKG